MRKQLEKVSEMLKQQSALVETLQEQTQQANANQNQQIPFETKMIMT